MAWERGKFHLGMIVWCVFVMTLLVFLAWDGGTENNLKELSKLGKLDKTERLILSPAYDGGLVVHLKEPMRNLSTKGRNSNLVFWLNLRQTLQKVLDIFRTTITDSNIESLVASYPGAKYRPFLDTDSIKLSKYRERLERLSGKVMPDWNLVFIVEIAEPAEAVRLYRELRRVDNVKVVYPRQRPILLDLAGTPDLTGLQGYLYSESTHGGLNAMVAWSAGITGSGVVLLDGEMGWNFEHEDLPIDTNRIIGALTCAVSGTTDNCRTSINHGTGVVGIMGGLNNEHGITGIAYGSDVYAFNYREEELAYRTDGIGETIAEEIPPGSVVAVELGVHGALSNPLSENQYGGLPMEVLPISFDVVRQATVAGITVITAAGNGSIDIGRADVYLSSQINISLTENDTGSIIVGGSYGTGHDHRRPPELNCGDRVNVFAWGSGVVTAGYLYEGNSFQWTTVPGGPNPPNDDPNAYFINNFGGTSAATAMVAGAAALVQSYAKRELGQTTRYLMPLKMREILVNSGVPQTATDGCNIGKQPRVDEAMGLVDGFLADARADYPELDSGEELTEERMIALRTLGVGIICREFDPINSDPICPDEEVFPVGDRLAKDLDFDGDGRADLVQWTNPSAGSGRSATWKLDLSSRGAGGDPSTGSGQDNFGEWDIEIAHDPVEGEWVWPYVIDMNRDGRTDFVVYDKEHGVWHIAFTDSSLIRDGTWHGWDWEIDYSSTWTDTLTLDPFATDSAIPDARYSRPVPGDYNNDGWIDIAIACSDGNWRIDHGGPNRADFGAFDRTVRYLSDARLAEAPGWAYPAFTYRAQGGADTRAYLSYKIPDGLSEEGRMIVLTPTRLTDAMANAAHIYGGNESIPVPGDFDGIDVGASPGIKNSGNWRISHQPYSSFADVPPTDVFGGNECRPIVGDFDGDSYDDRVVMCPNEWRIVYSSPDLFTSDRGDDGVRHIPLSYDAGDFSLPGRSYAGGISYESVRRLIEMFELTNSGIPPPIPVDMVVIY